MTVNLIKPMLTLVAIAVSLSSVHAELIDSSKTSIMTEAQASEYYTEATNFNSSIVQWTVRPKFSFPDTVLRKAKPGELYSVRVRAEVDKQGNIVKSYIVQSSSNKEIDESAISTLRDAKIKPFKKNGIAVRAVVTIPINYIVP